MLLNRKRAKEFMLKYDLTALIAASPVNVSYFTGLDCWMYRSFREYMWIPGGSTDLKQSYAVLPLDGDPVLILDHFTLPFAQNLHVRIRTYGQQTNRSHESRNPKSTHFADLLAAEVSADGPSGALADELDHLGVKRGNVGTEWNYMAKVSRNMLRKRFPSIALKDAPELFRLIRMSKTNEEVLRLKKAAEINEKALKRALEHAEVGSTMGDLRRTFAAEVGKDDAAVAHYIYCPRGIGITSFDEYSLSRGDVTYVDTGCTYKMYNSDTGATLAIGRAEEETVAMQKKLWEATESMFDQLRPGVKTNEVLGFLEKTFRTWGITDCHYEGHGIGLEVREHPIISKSDHKRVADSVVDESVNMALEEGMTLNIELPVTDFGTKSMQVERTFLVEERKTTEMTGWSKEIPYEA